MMDGVCGGTASTDNFFFYLTADRERERPLSFMYTKFDTHTYVNRLQFSSCFFFLFFFAIDL